jgi:primosomal protein N' (replication factor Y)
MAQKITRLLTADDRRQTTLIGPAPCFFARVGGLYRWQVILRGPEPESLIRELKLDGWRAEVEPVSLL